MKSICLLAAQLGCILLPGALKAEEAKPPVDPFGIVTPGDTSAKDDTFRNFPDPAGHSYFPVGSENYYTRYLAAMKEPSLMPREGDQASYAVRFTWLRSFHDPIAIRVWQDGAGFRMRAVRLAKQRDYSPGPAASDTTRVLTQRELQELQRLAENKELWKPLNKDELLAVEGGLDGAQWIFERRNGNEYSMMDLWCPEHDLTPEGIKNARINTSKLRDFKSFVRLGVQLLKLADLLPEKWEIY